MIISAIVSCYNSESYIEKCIEDLLNQTICKNGLMEIIVIDGGSQQNEECIISDFQANHEFVHYLKAEKLETLYSSWNRGVRLAVGKYITNANTDDRHDANCLEELVNHLENNPELDLAYGTLFKSTNPNETYEDNDKSVPCTSQKFFPGSLLLHDYTGAQPVWRKSIHDKIGLFDKNYEVVGDYEFVLRAVSRGCKFGYVPEAQGLMLWHKNALSTKDSKAHSEKRKLFNKYRTPENLTRIYRDSCANNKSIEEEAHLDQGIRALCFYPQFNSGNPSFDFEFARKCFSFSESNPAFIHNLKTLNQLVTFEDYDVCTNEKNFSDFFFYGSGEQLPPEYLLKGTPPSYLELNGLRKVEGKHYHTFSFSLRKFVDFFFGLLPINNLTLCDTIYICGLNQRGMLVGHWLNVKTSAKIVYLDQNAKALSFPRTKVQTYEDGISGLGKSAFILAMSSHHWDAVESLIFEFCPNAFIYKLDHI